MTFALPLIEGDPERERQSLIDDLRAKIDGEVRFDTTSRALYATDGSNYRQVPIGVVIPRHTEDVAQALSLCRERGLPVLARGGGTSLAGQCCNTAVVFDYSKYMNQIISVDPDRRLARVQPGCILDELREHTTEEYGLRIGPDPSTHNHCTIGGMIGNNSCGVHALLSEFYGPGPRTEDNVDHMHVLTYGGTELRVGKADSKVLQARLGAGGREAELYQGMLDLRDRYASLIRERFPDIPRRVSGYSLPALLPEHGFNLARALVGSEGTLCAVLEATMCLCPAFEKRALLLLGFEDIFAAGDAIATVREYRPIGLEGIDDTLARETKMQDLDRGALKHFPEGKGWLLVEFGADTLEEARSQAEQAQRELRSRGVAHDMALHTDEAVMEAIWHIREAALGATAFTPGENDSWPGWEDSAVPIEQVGPYLRKLKGLYQRFGYQASLYGHLGQGCIHSRINFDLNSAAGLERYRSFTREAAELITSLRGSLSGEHGDGQSRADLLDVMFGSQLITAFEEMKDLWDPDNKMNPGKVVRPNDRDENLRIGPNYDPWEPETHFAYPRDGGSFAHAALRCVGVGECRRTHGGTMCPSYMVTRDERDCTRGRARTLYEMSIDGVTKERWQSEVVKEALELCLSCKACKNECPVGVDMATYKAEFLSHYYEAKPRPRVAYAFGWIDRWAKIGGAIPNFMNLAARTPGLRALAKKAAGMAPEREIPRFAPKPFHAHKPTSRRHGDAPNGDGQASNGNGNEQNHVMLFVDTFNNYFHPETLRAAYDVLDRMGFSVHTPKKKLCCGRALYDYGMLDRAQTLWRENLDALEACVKQDTPIVVLEPSCAAAFRDEFPNLMAADPRAKKLSESVFTLAEFLDQHTEVKLPSFPAKAIVHRHCHHHAIMGFDADRNLLDRIGLDFEVLDSGCCGMAGSFGFEAGHYDISKAAAERVLLPRVREAEAETMIVADGFSCREQVRQLSGKTALHLAQVIERAFSQQTEPSQKENSP